MPSEVILHCAACGKNFYRPLRRVRHECIRNEGFPENFYCSRECLNRSNDAREIHHCRECGEEFSFLLSRNKNGKNPGHYCSRECANKGKRKPGSWEIRVCPRCKKEFTARIKHLRKYCSYECSGRAKNQVEVICKICQEPYHVAASRVNKTKTCSLKCQAEYCRRHNRRKPLDGLNRLQRKSWGPLRDTVLHRDNYRCWECGSIKHLMVHHIVPWAVSQNDHPDNLITLCGACHFKADEVHRSHFPTLGQWIESCQQ